MKHAKLNEISVIILAGGKGSRLNNQNKGLLLWNNQPLIAHIIKKIELNTRNILISANRDLAAYKKFNYPVIEDTVSTNEGPVSGILSCLATVQTPFTAVVPVDAPFFPADYLETMWNHYSNMSKITVAHDAKRPQFLFCLFATALKTDLQHYFDQGNRSIRHWLMANPHEFVYFKSPDEPFFNINTLDDWQIAQKS